MAQFNFPNFRTKIEFNGFSSCLAGDNEDDVDEGVSLLNLTPIFIKSRKADKNFLKACEAWKF